WFRAHCPAAFETRHLNSILSRAPIWVRLQLNDRSLALNEFKGKGWDARPAAGLPDAFALPPNAGVADTDVHRRGFVEIQDLGSQLVLAHTPIVPGQIWLDACAGAGGKTLQLAHALISAPGRSENLPGRVDATDLRPSMLEELHERASRARLANVRIVPTAAGPYDGVLIDAPCSGSGTWRRLPHMKWYTQPAMLAEFAVLQLSLLAKNSSLVKPGGLLVYATCSLSHVENLDVVAAFLAQHTDFAAEKPTKKFGGHYDGHGTTLLPGTLDSDGFYVSLLRRQ
ncbi:MAG: RsmB/NOP family class I SAM-dependent RNA methyltransferase, partial [Candidatus Didemnitutus sp.]|nr:RsmB/NOP family class I SAM-dependent RNA methyltransferase [Candidatus Didemnitutus sp.]